MSDVTLDQVLAWFDKVSAVPRSSGDEAQIASLIADHAQQLGCEVVRDQTSNLLVRKPAHPGQEERTPLALQAHLDMVAEKDPGSTHDFRTDPIEVVRDGGTLIARGTALGADDGIGVALLLSLLDSTQVRHPDLELLFTTQEEVGLVGAKLLDVGPLRSRQLLNVDAEQEGVFLTSCAGGVTIELAVDLGPTSAIAAGHELHLYGLTGGHSGLDIDKQRPNAIVAAAELLRELAGLGELQLVALEAPGKFNAISREVTIRYGLGNADPALHDQAVQDWFGRIRSLEPDARLDQQALQHPAAYSAAATRRVVDLLGGLPVGVHTMSPDLPGVVESSLNVGLAEHNGAVLAVTTSIRSSDPSRQRELVATLERVADAVQARLRSYGDYPPWRYEPDNPLVAHAQRCYRELFGAEPKVTGVHGGLECAVLKQHFPELPMLSVGAELTDCHTPRERADIASIDHLTQLVVRIVETLA